MESCFHPELTKDEVNQISALGLAHIGDGVFELLVRTFLCTRGKGTNGNLHKLTVRFVSAPAQAEFADKLLPQLSDEELAVYKRGRNAHVHSIPKNATGGQYSKATGLEALFGALYLSGQQERIEALFQPVMEEFYAL